MIGIMGGTFDPIHNGHLRIAEEAADLFALSEVRFIPAKQPALKVSPQVSAEQRLKWVRQAIAGNERFCVDDRELQRSGSSYTIDTLRSLAEERPTESLLFIMGVDTFNQFEAWKDWQEILEQANLLVCDRPNSEIKQPRWSESRWCRSPDELLLKKSGGLYFLEVTPMPVSSSMIRHKVSKKQSVRYLLPDVICQEITQQQIYLPPRRS